MSTYRQRRLLAALAITLVPVLTASGCGEDASDSSADTATGGEDGAPALSTVELTPLAGAPTLRLGEASDLPVVVNVWATWCVPCRKEMPAFQAVAKQLDGEVRFVGVNLGDTEEAATAFVTDTGVTFDQYLDPDMTAQAAFSIVNMPSTALLRPDGSVAEIHSGALDETELTELIADELDVG